MCMHSESDHLAAAVGGLLYITTPHHAARAHSGVRRARPDVEMSQRCARTAAARRAERDFPRKSAESRRGGRAQPTCHDTPRPATLPALAPRHVGHGPASYDPVLYISRVRARVRKLRRSREVGGVGQGEILSYLFYWLAARTSCGWSGWKVV